MTVRQVLPAGLAQMAPGPQLGVALGGLDLHALTGSDLVEVLCARARQLAHDQAQLLATMVEVGLADPAAGPDEVARLAAAPEYAAEEIRAALAWTRNAAYREYHFAQTLLTRLPAVHTALDDGVICRSKAWLFSELCAELTDEQAQVVCDRLLPKAGRLTTGELAARIKKLALALDPDWAARRYTRAVRNRDVIGYLDQDGTATVTGRGLPAEQAATACARIEDLAKAAKRAGHPGRIGPLRADIYIALLEGRWTHHTREEIITDLLTQASPIPTPDQAVADTSTANTPAGPDPTTDAHPTTDPAPDPVTEVDSATDADPTTEADPTTGTAPVAGSEADPVAQASAAADTATPTASPGVDSPDSTPPVGAERVGVEVRVGLATLLGHDRHPAEIPGWGPITPDTARVVVAAQHRAEWRFTITDPQGQLLLAGITRHRPTTPQISGASGAVLACRGGIVELHLPATVLAELATHPDTTGPWAAVIADIAAQYDAYRVGSAPDGPAVQDPAARFAGAALRRHVQIRDRFCVFVGCRCPARHADIDHTIDHARGGSTTAANTGPLCPHDHLVKHDGGWRLHQSEPGHFVWISPLGRIYPTRPQPISIDLPDPLPRPDCPDDTPPLTVDEDGPILYRPPPEPEPEPPPPPPPVDPDEPPPF